MGGIRWPIVTHITIYIEHMIQSILIASMCGCSLLRMWAVTPVKDGVFYLFLSYFPFGETKNFCSAIVTHFVVGDLYKM